MTNGDVYYIKGTEAEMLRDYITDGRRTYTTRDVKSGARITIITRHISSIVRQTEGF